MKKILLPHLVVVWALLAAASLCAQSYEPYTFSMFAGNPPGSVNGVGTAARFDSPSAVALDSLGNKYVADTNNHTIRKITPSGEVSTFAGLIATAANVDGSASSARFNFPFSLAVDGADNIFVADRNNNSIRKITPAGDVSTVIGGLSTPRGVAVDSAGNLYVTTSGGVRKIAPGNVVTTLGSGFALPFGIAVDTGGNVYVADNLNNRISKIAPDGSMTVLAGGGGFFGGSADGTGSAAQFAFPTGLAVDNAGYLYVADTSNNAIRKVTPAGEVTTIAGLGGSGNVGSTDGIGTAARFSRPSGVAVDSSGNLHVADTNNHTIREITAAGVVSTLAGSPSVGNADGPASAARFNRPNFMAFDSAGNAYVSDVDNHAIRKITADGVVSTLAGSSTPGSADGIGGAAQFKSPTGVAVDGAGNVYVSDSGNHTIRQVTPAGVVTTLAGSVGMFGSVDGSGNAARFNNPNGLAVDAAGNVYVADFMNFTIRKITPGGDVTTLAGSPNFFFPARVDGTGSDARFNAPRAVVVDGAGIVYVLDGSIRKVTAEGVVTTLPTPGLGIFVNGFALDNAGNFYVGGGSANTVLKVTPAGTVTTLGGMAFNPGSADGTGAAARFRTPSGVAIDSAGTLYVVDSGNNAIRTGRLLPATTTPVGSDVMLNAGSVGATDIDLTIGQVSQAGTTTISPINPAYAGGLPSGYELAGADLAFEISTTAIYQGPILIRFQVSVDPATFSQLRVLHNENGTLVDRTASDPGPDATTQTIYALVPTLSPFVIAKLVPSLTATVQSPINSDGSSVFTVKRGVVPVKFTLGLSGNATCDLPPATISLTRTTTLGGTETVNESSYSMAADNGSNFRIDACQYIYNLNSGALGVGTYRADIKINGSTVGSATFQLK